MCCLLSPVAQNLARPTVRARVSLFCRLVGPSVYEFPRKKTAVSRLRLRRFTAAAALVFGAFAGACSEPTSIDGNNAPPSESPAESPAPAGVVHVAPDTVTMEPGDSMYFVALDSLANGTVGAATVEWSATTGTVDSAGLYRAPSQPGSYRVIARGANGADSALVVVGSGLGTGATPVTGTNSAVSALLSGVQLVLLPSTLSLAPGGKQQFSAVARYSGTTYSIPASSVTVTWQASGGTITSGGYFTAPTSSGSYRVIARVVDSRLAAPVADTTIVTVRSVTTAPAPSPTSVLRGADAGDGDGGGGGDAAVDRPGEDE